MKLYEYFIKYGIVKVSGTTEMVVGDYENFIRGESGEKAKEFFEQKMGERISIKYIAKL